MRPATRDLAADTFEAPTALSPSLGATVGYMLYRSFLQIQQVYVEALRGKAHPRDFTIVARLLAAGPCSQQELGECLAVNRSMMVHVIDELEQAGLVVRDRNASDRRAYLLRATSRAESELAAAAPTLLEADAHATRRLREAERRRLRKLLTALLGDELPAVVAPVSQMTGYLIARAYFARHNQADQLIAPLGLDIREYATLTTIEDLAPCSQQQVATMLGVSSPVVVELIDALEPRGLVVRERNPSDRRSYALRLTDDGAKLRQRARDTLAGSEAEVGERIGSAERSELCSLLRQLVGAEPTI
jgi:DNA-binding MarR family transcriptional regulator